MTFQKQPKEVSEFVKARKVREKITFVRKNLKVEGTIFKILENSCIVEISKKDAKRIGALSNLTVVSHKNYEVQE
ncbi:MAG: DUF2187 family protein [Paenisporosarcina sp.]